MTLTEVSYYSRRMAPFAILVFVVLLIMFYLVKLFIILTPTEGPAGLVINPAFKEMKQLQITDATPSDSHTYVMDNVEGKPVTATEAAQVFYMVPAKFSLNYQEKMYLMARNLGFADDIRHTLIGTTEAQFADEKKTFKVDIQNFNFKFDTDIQHSPELFTNNSEPDKEDATNRAIDFLKTNDSYPDDLAKGRTNVIFLQYDKVSSQTAVLTDSQDANMVEVDFYRADIDQFPIVAPHYFNSQNYVTMVLNNGTYTVVSSQLRFYEKSTTEVGLYPVLTGDEAFAKLATGSGYIVSGAQIDKKEIAVKRMFLGYYDSDIYQEHMMPVYVFLGDDNFVAYVPAIADRWIIDESKLK